MAEEERETKETTQLDPMELGALLEADRPTQTIARDELLGLIGQSAPPPPTSPHTVSRERLRTPSVAPMRALEKPIESPFEEPLDTDISPSLSPLLVFGVISILVVVFIAITRMS